MTGSQPRSFRRAMEETARHPPRFTDTLRFFAKPTGIVAFLIAAFLFAVCASGVFHATIK
jgi:hypothetical protein